MHMAFVICCLATAVALGGCVAAGTVQEDGSGRASGLRIHHVTPATVHRLWDELADGRDGGYDDEIVFSKGTYRLADLPRRGEGRGEASAVFGFAFGKKGGRLVLRGATGHPEDVVLDGLGVGVRAFSFTGKGTVEMSGLTLTRINAAKDDGGALAFDWRNTDSRVWNCRFVGNGTAARGGAAKGGNFEGCLFEGNFADVGGALCAGGYRKDGAVVGCTFRNNVARKSAGAVSGGQITNCLFEGNVCTDGMNGAVDTGEFPPPRLVDCVFRDNQAPLHHPSDSWEARAAGTTYTIVLNERDSDKVRGNRVESWGYGFHGRKDGGPYVDSVSVRPGQDLMAVRDALRSSRTPAGRAEIVLEDGVHTLTNCLEIQGFDRDLTIRARHAGKAIVAGGWNFLGKDMRKSADRPGLLEIDVPATVRAFFGKGTFGGFVDGFGGAYDGNRVARPKRPDLVSRPKRMPPAYPMFTVDTKAMVPGRWPSGGRYFYVGESNVVQKAGEGETNTLFTTFTGREKTWNWKDADISVWGELAGCGYSKEAYEAVGYDASRQAIDFGKATFSPRSHMYFINVLEETDEPGEWCYDRRSGKLYLCPPAGFGPQSVCVLGTHWDHFIRVESEGVRIEGLTFTGKIGCYAVALAKGRRNAVAGCRFSGLAFKGVSVSGERSEVRSCDFEDIQSQAVEMRGGDVVTLTPASNRVENCVFRHCCFGQLQGHQGVAFVSGCGNVFAHNDIRDSIAPGIGFIGTDVVIEYNRVLDVTKDNSDSNAIGTGGNTSYGATVRFNDVGGSPGYSQGIYLDDLCSGVKVYGNVIHDFGMFGLFMGGGRDNVLSNNVVTAGWGGLHTDNRGLFWPVWKNQKKDWEETKKRFGIPDSNFAKKYPKICAWGEDVAANLLWAPIGNEIVNNLFLDIKGYGTQVFVALKREFPRERNLGRGNLVVRTKGLLPGEYDLASGDSSNAPTNHMSAGSSNTFGPFVPVRVLDGTPDDPIDMGFVKVPSARFDTQDYLFIEQGWMDTAKYNDACAQGRFEGIRYDCGDFSLKADARVFREIPGFQPIPWNKIGVYRDAWRKALPD